MPLDREGLLIIFEGGDGTGKTTQVSRFARFLEDRGWKPLHIREPGSTPLGEKVRDILLTPAAEGGVEITPESEMLLYMACRSELYRAAIAPALQKGRPVLLERSYYSTYAYQGCGLGIDPEMILSLGKWVSLGVEPRRVILLDMAVEKSLARVEGGMDRIESRGTGFHEKVRQGFLALSRRFPRWFRVVDADGGIEEVESRIHAELGDLF